MTCCAVRWTDWSVLQTLTVTTPLSTTIDQYQWRDGWTLTGGVVHSFSAAFAGQMSLTWDRGVSTGWDLRDEVIDTLTGYLDAGGRLLFAIPELEVVSRPPARRPATTVP